MTLLLCRNKVKNYKKWKSVFDANSESALQAGLKLINLWRSLDDPNNVFFLFEVADIGKAKSFLADPASVETGDISGVLEGEYYFLKDG